LERNKNRIYLASLHWIFVCFEGYFKQLWLGFQTFSKALNIFVGVYILTSQPIPLTLKFFRFCGLFHVPLSLNPWILPFFSICQKSCWTRLHVFSVKLTYKSIFLGYGTSWKFSLHIKLPILVNEHWLLFSVFLSELFTWTIKVEPNNGKHCWRLGVFFAKDPETGKILDPKLIKTNSTSSILLLKYYRKHFLPWHRV